MEKCWRCPTLLFIAYSCNRNGKRPFLARSLEAYFRSQVRNQALMQWEEKLDPVAEYGCSLVSVTPAQTEVLPCRNR